MGSRMAAASPALTAAAASCIRSPPAAASRLAASRGKATLPMADTSGTGTMVTEAAMAYRPRSAGETSWESTSWSR